MKKKHMSTYIGRTLCGRIVATFVMERRYSNCETCRRISRYDRNWAEKLLGFYVNPSRKYRKDT